MGNPITWLVSGTGHVIGSIFGHPLEFLSGKSCSSVCGPTWDLECYIENFCIQHLLKFFAVSFLFYLVMLFFYFLYKLRIFHCIFKTSFKLFWACFSTVFTFWERVCTILYNVLYNVHERRKQYKRDIEMAADMSNISYEEDADMETSISYHNEHYRRMRKRSWSGHHKRTLVRKSLKARNHRVHVGVDSVNPTKRKHIKHDDVRVIRTSSFAKKGPRHKRSKHQNRRQRDENIDTEDINDEI
ncbi:hypothetical protein SSX86_014156 [Deinandra increscens subsp. villosa]|uniref:Uncharacterized protein n=1 Tax=Deinandra increscens subsp. villosa TaxID=3103831 RepID=A0AAP0D906_9ASTR